MSLLTGLVRRTRARERHLSVTVFFEFQKGFVGFSEIGAAVKRIGTVIRIPSGYVHDARAAADRDRLLSHFSAKKFSGLRVNAGFCHLKPR